MRHENAILDDDELSKASVAQLLDPIWRIRHIYTIRNEAGEPEPFRPNDEQNEVLEAIYIHGWRCIIIPKARQIGFSTLMAIICLDNILFGSNIQCSLVDLTAINAKKKLTDKILYAFDRLPPSIRSCYVERTRNSQQGEFAVSNIYSTDPEAISVMFADDKQRGGTNQILWISEWAESGQVSRDPTWRMADRRTRLSHRRDYVARRKEGAPMADSKARPRNATGTPHSQDSANHVLCMVA